MAVSPQTFPPRKRRPSAGAFISPNVSTIKLVQSLLHLSQEMKPLQSLLKRNSISIVRKLKLLSILFEELSRTSYFPSSASICLEEMYIVLERIKTLLEDCANGSQMWLLMHHHAVAQSFHELTLELSTLFDVFPVKEIDLNEDVADLVVLIRKQCSSRAQPYVDPKDDGLRIDLMTMLEKIKKQIVPDYSKLSEIFERLGLHDRHSCTREIEVLEEEFQNQTEESKSEVITLVGLVRYAKCVLFGASTPRSSSESGFERNRTENEVNIPSDFRCPITLDLMRDPVVVGTGQTYDRGSINIWMESGHNTCPKTGQTLPHTQLIPNKALKHLIALWCRQNGIPFDSAADKKVRKMGAINNKTALEATKMTVMFLINKLSASQSIDATNRLIHELRVLAKTNSDSRNCIAEAGAIPLLVRHLGSEHPNLQVNAVTTILNLSISESNKIRIAETDGAMNGVIEVLGSGATWEAKGNAAATIFSISSGIQTYNKRLGRKVRVITGLINLVKDGPTSSKRDALVAIMNLAGDRDTVRRLVEGGVVEMISGIMNEMQEEAVILLEVVVRRGGDVATAATRMLIKKLGAVLRNGTDRARESAVATLVNLCRKGGSATVAELAGIPGIEREIVRELMGSGTERARRKSASLVRILRSWAAGLDGDATVAEYSSSRVASSSRVVVPS